ncbi:MAG: hypothetical protein PWP31_1804 [Clostridia bacterium]|nr:hypothetical protein [Clostridia bacterium]
MAGRPSKYKPEYAEQAYKLCLLGATDKDMADFFAVCEDTINEWKKAHKDFSESLKKGKMEADAVIAQKLFHRAKGYEHPEDKIFNDSGKPLVVPTVKHYPPDTTAAIFWLKNRQPKKWRDKQEIDQNVNANVNMMYESLLEEIEEETD